uniref:Uncharacterized protein n=1 Tax=Arundo donax TaxID=35708 RepID=A0A0A9EU93_ARUDO
MSKHNGYIRRSQTLNRHQIEIQT